MSGEGGRNIFDLKNNPNATLNEDYAWYCPVSLSEIRTDPSHNGINRKEPNYFENLQRCINVEGNPHCQSRKTLEQTSSAKLVPGKWHYMSLSLYVISYPYYVVFFVITLNILLNSECKAAGKIYQGREIEDCTNHIWRDTRHRWRRGCVKIGGRLSQVFECALITNTRGLGIVKSRCRPENLIACNMKIPRLIRNPDVDYIYN